MLGLQEFLRKQKIKSLLNRLSRLVYSDKFPIATEEDREKFINRIATKNDKNNLLATYLAVQSITRNISYQRFYEPVNDNTVLEIIDELNSINKFSTEKEFLKQYHALLNSALDLNRIKAYRYLRLTSHYLANGREAYKKNPYSFEGMRYIREKNNKRPLSIKEQSICKNAANELAQLDKQVKDAKEEYDASVSKLKAQVTFDKMVQEVKEGQENNPDCSNSDE